MMLSQAPSERRVWLLTILSWLAAPSSFVAVPLASFVVLNLDVERTSVIDLIVGATVGVAGYVQWFVGLPAILNRFRCGGFDG
jgi:hypothetical protein